jgi:hypothetical protein
LTCSFLKRSWSSHKQSIDSADCAAPLQYPNHFRMGTEKNALALTGLANFRSGWLHGGYPKWASGLAVENHFHTCVCGCLTPSLLGGRK